MVYEYRDQSTKIIWAESTSPVRGFTDANLTLA